MKNNRLVAVILFVILMISMNLTVFAEEKHGDNPSPEEFALEQIEIIDINDEACPWSDETVIVDTVILYNLEQSPNGYIFKLQTRNEESGFIQIHVVDGIYSIYCYAYEGDSEAECMMDYWKIEDDLISYIYFLGSFKYLIDGKEGGYIDLATNDNVVCTKEELQKIETAYVNRIEAAPVVLEPDINLTAQSYTIAQIRDRSFQWPITSDFTDITIKVNGISYTVHDHCSPTAATAIVKYLNYLGRTDCSGNETTRQTFAEMYVALNTNECRFNDSTYNGVGTARSQIAPGIKWYANNNGYTLIAEKVQEVSLSGMKSQLGKK